MEVDNGRRLSTEPLNAMTMKIAPTTMYETVNCNMRLLPVSRVPIRRALPAVGEIPGPRIYLHVQDRCEGADHTGCCNNRWLGSATRRGKSGGTSMEGAACCPLRSYLTRGHSQLAAGGLDVFDCFSQAQAQLP